MIKAKAKIKFGIVLMVVVVGVSLLAAHALRRSPKKAATKASLKKKVFLIDNFESGSLRAPREWWTFDIQKAKIASNKKLKKGVLNIASKVGDYSFLFSGRAKSWYAGGTGTYLAKEKQDLSKYNAFQIDIYGYGEGSGSLKIELYDDDNKNWQVEQDPKKSYAATKDDKLVYTVTVDWKGWKRLIIPLADFIDDNPYVGDDIWNPKQGGSEGSGGLLQLQLICIAGSEKGKIKYNLDNIALTESGK